MAAAKSKLRVTPKKRIECRPITLCYGEPGIGKSTFAADAPGVVFLCCEQGTNNISVSRARIEDTTAPDGERDPKTFDDVAWLLDNLAMSPPEGMQNIAIDTLDSLESFIWSHICRMGNKRSIADYGYGKGYDLAIDAFKGIQFRLERLKAAGYGIILLAHSKVEKYNNPEGSDFDYHEIKLHKKAAGLWVEWADNVLFARREQYALEENGKIRGVGTGSRFLLTQKMPAYVAKNRFSLPEKLPLNWADYEQAMANFKPANPEELIAHAEELIAKLEPESQKAATEALSKISKNDSSTLAKFVDYCRGKVTIESGEKPTEQAK